MLRAIFYTIAGLFIVGIIVYACFIYSFGHSFMKSSGGYTDAQYFHIQNRLAFQVPYRGEVLDSLLVNGVKTDTNYTIHENLSEAETPDSNSHCWCYCSNITKTLKFNGDPKEIYLVTYGVGEHDVGIDWVIKLKNNKWTCFPTSKLDSIEQERIENRFMAIVAKFPLKDTSDVLSNWQSHSVDYNQ
jgi:hypothetical protein